MRVLVSGATGLIGSALLPTLKAAGHEPVALYRGCPGSGPTWRPERHEIDDHALDGVDAVVHLAGESIGSKRWTPAQKDRILNSRIDGTTTLAEAVASASQPPRVFLCGSAIGFYGDRGDERIDESSDSGSDFAAYVCRTWEESTAAIDTDLTRVVHMRTGIVLSANGGALAEQLRFFKAGLGGRIGTGRQWFSWISLADEIGAILHLLESGVHGPANLTAPAPVTNADFTKTLGLVLHRPTVIPTPTVALWAKLGRELTRTLLQGGAHVAPGVLLESGYQFRHPTLEDALRAALNRTP